MFSSSYSHRPQVPPRQLFNEQRAALVTGLKRPEREGDVFRGSASRMTGTMAISLEPWLISESCHNGYKICLICPPFTPMADDCSQHTAEFLPQVGLYSVPSFTAVTYR
jgi:hypothetical protein